jgi:kynurenine formamidase
MNCIRNLALGTLTYLLLTIPALGKSPLLEAYDVVDLTHTLDERFPYIPVPGITFPFALEPIATISENGVAANRWKIHEHLGTQIDAPNHFVQGGAGLETLTGEDLIVPMVVIDYREFAAVNADAELSIAQIQQWEARYGKIQAGVVVMLYTGWDSRILDAKAYINADGQHVKHFPGFGAAAAQFLIKERNVWGVGVDTLSFDPGRDNHYLTHKIVLGAGKWALEAVANLEHVPPTGAILFVGAPKVRNATGGPVRLVALRPKVAPLETKQLKGTWRSPAPERIDRPDGSAVFITKVFTFSNDQWRIVFTVAADAKGKTRLFSGDFSGPYILGKYVPLIDAYQGQFLFSKRSLTIYSP